MTRRTFAAALLAAGCSPRSANGPVELNATGSTFIQQIMNSWTERFLDRTGGAARVNYQGGGSGAGVDQLTKRLTAFGCTDAPMNASQTRLAEDAGGPVVHVPLVVGAVVPMYRLDGLDQDLTFTGPLLADIFLGRVTRWNDPAVRAANPRVPLPDLAIQPVVRSDTSGSTFVFTDYLSAVSGEFREKVGASTAARFPVGVAQNKSDGVAGHVARTPGAVGYIELTYALDKGARYGAVVNRAGRPIRADLASITAAAAVCVGERSAHPPYSLHALTYRLIDAAGERSYPIAAMSFGLLFRRQAGPKGRAAVAFLRWCASAEGQDMASKRNYAPLPEALQRQVASALDRIEFAD